jgi:hypothetical protein
MAMATPSQTPEERLIAFKKGATIAAAEQKARQQGKGEFTVEGKVFQTAPAGRGAALVAIEREKKPTKGITDVTTQSSHLVDEESAPYAPTGIERGGVQFQASHFYGLPEPSKQNIENIPGQNPRMIVIPEGTLPVSTNKGVMLVERKEPDIFVSRDYKGDYQTISHESAMLRTGGFQSTYLTEPSQALKEQLFGKGGYQGLHIQEVRTVPLELVLGTSRQPLVLKGYFPLFNAETPYRFSQKPFEYSEQFMRGIAIGAKDELKMGINLLLDAMPKLPSGMRPANTEVTITSKLILGMSNSMPQAVTNAEKYGALAGKNAVDLAVLVGAMRTLPPGLAQRVASNLIGGYYLVTGGGPRVLDTIATRDASRIFAPELTMDQPMFAVAAQLPAAVYILPKVSLVKLGSVELPLREGFERLWGLKTTEAIYRGAYVKLAEGKIQPLVGFTGKGFAIGTPGEGAYGPQAYLDVAGQRMPLQTELFQRYDFGEYQAINKPNLAADALYSEILNSKAALAAQGIDMGDSTKLRIFQQFAQKATDIEYLWKQPDLKFRLESKTWSPEEIRTIDEYTAGWRVKFLYEKIYGSHVGQAYQSYQYARPIHDIEIQAHGELQGTQLGKGLVDVLKAKHGSMVRFANEEGRLGVYKFVKDATTGKAMWDKGIELKYAGDPDSMDMPSEGVFGYKFNRGIRTIERSKVATAGEDTLRKIGSSSTRWGDTRSITLDIKGQKGDAVKYSSNYEFQTNKVIIEPASHRAKDPIDAIMRAKELSIRTRNQGKFTSDSGWYSRAARTLETGVNWQVPEFKKLMSEQNQRTLLRMGSKSETSIKNPIASMTSKTSIRTIMSASPSASSSAAFSRSISASASSSLSRSVSRSMSSSTSASMSPSRSSSSPSRSASPSMSPSVSQSPSVSPSVSPSPSRSPSRSWSPSPPSPPMKLPSFGGADFGKSRSKVRLPKMPSARDYAASIAGLLTGKTIKTRPASTKTFNPLQLRLPIGGRR